MSMMSTFEERKQARARWPVRRFPLGQEPLTDERDGSSVDERIALVWTLTRRQWAFAGLRIATMPRSRMPGRVIRLSDDR